MEEFSKLSVVQVRTAVPASTGAEAGMVVLQEDSHPRRSLRIIIGTVEAKAIHSAWQGAVSSRPTTWDTFVSAVGLLGATVRRVVITAVEQERHFYANLELEQDGELKVLSCRPSDGIAFALRAYRAEIVAAEEVLLAAGLLPDGTRPERRPVATEPEAAAAAVGEAAAAEPEATPRDPGAAVDEEGIRSTP